MDALETTGQGFNAIEVYSDGGVDKILEEITASARAIPQDVTTAKGRKAIASLGHKVARVKVHLDGLGKDLAAEWKDKVRAVDTERKRLRDTLDDLKEEILAPKTEWDQAEAERIEEIRGRIAAFQDIAAGCDIAPMTSTETAECIGRMEAKLIDDLFGEFVAEAAKAKDAALDSMRKLRASRWAREQERAELERLRAEEEERVRIEAQAEHKRQQEEREQRIREQAAAKAKWDAEAAAERERVAAQDMADAKLNAEKQARQNAEREVRRAKQQVEDQAREAAESEARRKQYAEMVAEQARLDTAQAIQNEKDRVKQEADASKAAADNREKSRRNRAQVMGNIVSDLSRVVDGGTAVRVAKELANDNIRHVQVVW